MVILQEYFIKQKASIDSAVKAEKIILLCCKIVKYHADTPKEFINFLTSKIWDK
uniref:Uncharacterized protein n=1 Tax=uncultured Desulfobacterium sp. TaxID=201089 RepID=E1YGD3_9BACT|nr:unknown protein [uncultured Desulfobacterium sp.]